MVKFLAVLAILIFATGLVACGSTAEPSFPPTPTPRAAPTFIPTPTPIAAPVANPVPPPIFSFTYYQQEKAGKILVRGQGQTLEQACSPHCTFESEKEVLEWLSKNISFAVVGADKDTYVYVRSPFPPYEEMFSFLLQQGDAKSKSLYISPGSQTPACPVGTERYTNVEPTYYCIGTPSLETWLAVQAIPSQLADIGPPTKTISIVGPLTLKAP